jgi:amidohydrolase
VLDTIKKLAVTYKDEFIQTRRTIHANPELSYQEFETSAFIQKKLGEWGIPFQIMATTGVVGLIKGKNAEERIVALRADMDALPIVEENEVSYKSKNNGVMHACGHDVHTTCLLGAAKILNETKADWSGTVKLIFQPGEEKNPGGASIMIKEGVLENPAPQKIFGLHVHNILQVGEFSFRGGMVMASTDEIYITIKAKGGHAAAPHLTADPILIAAQLVVNLQQIVSRNNNAFNPTILSITSIQGGTATNIIPSEVKLMGTFRAMNEEWRYKAHELIKTQTTLLVQAMGATVDVRIDVGYPFVKNDEALSAAARLLAETYAGIDKVSETELRMGAEDFAYYSQIIPACFYRLGVGNIAKGITIGVHTPTFNVDEDAIEHGIGMMAWLGAMG